MGNDPFKENFYGKRKKTTNVLTVLSISHKSGVKTFLKLIVTNGLRALVSITHNLFSFGLYFFGIRNN